MCGKLTAMASWAAAVAFSQPPSREAVKESDNDRKKATVSAPTGHF